MDEEKDLLLESQSPNASVLDSTGADSARTKASTTVLIRHSSHGNNNI